MIIYQAPSGDYRYFNRADDRDQGDVISFIKNRLENPRIPGITASPGKNVWASVLDNARRFLQLPEPQRKRSPQLQQAITPVQRGDQYVPDFLLQTTPLTDTRYLSARGLREETLGNDCFKGRILNHVHEGVSKTGQPYQVVHTAFPQVYHDKIVGLESKAQGLPGQAADALTSSALWLSNSTAKTHTLLVLESALDALSHYQLQQPTHAMYASCSGPLTDNQVVELKRLITNQNLKTVKPAFANTLAGHVCDTRLITGLAHVSTPMQIERTLPGLLTVTIHAAQEAYFRKLHEHTKRYNQQVTEGYIQLAGRQAPLGNSALQSELILAGKEADNCYQFHIPKRREALAFFNRALIQSYPMSVKLDLEKARAWDWNQQLQESRRGPALELERKRTPSEAPPGQTRKGLGR
ncbi:hypothetical protein H9I52_22720 [Hymenobacter sp. BT491]|nr:hypothetical protein [Hymenobacter sp. BT491]